MPAPSIFRRHQMLLRIRIERVVRQILYGCRKQTDLHDPATIFGELLPVWILPQDRLASRYRAEMGREGERVQQVLASDMTRSVFVPAPTKSATIVQR
jgi:hypothetical protein